MKTEEPKELTRINFEAGQFMANGVKYYIQADQISVARFIKYEEFSYNVAFDQSFQKVAGTLKEIYEILTEGDSALQAIHKAAELALNQLKAVKEFGDTRKPAVLWFCTLFFNRAGEDITTWDPALAAEKIQDWEAEGIHMQDFFLFSTSALNGFKKIFQYAIEQASETENIT